MLRLKLLSSIGDKHFVGLNALEVLDWSGRPLLYPPATSFRVLADPTMASSGSINEDKRVPENLVNGVTDGADKNQCFMAPLVNPRKWGVARHAASTDAGSSDQNQVYILFDEPQEVSGLLIYNYTSNPARGVCEIEVLVNESLVFIVTCS